MGTTYPFPLLAFQEDLLHDEGLRQIPYKDSLGNWTDGVGHYIGNASDFALWCKATGNSSGAISVAHAHVLLGMDIQDTLRELDRRYGWWRQMSPTRQRVLANMMFNLGPAKLAEFTHTLGAMARGTYAQASTQMLQSKWAKEVGDRAKRLAWMMENDNTHFPVSIA